jgi:hypothetical protein
MGKSRVEANRLQSLTFVFLILAITGFMFSELYGKKSRPKRMANWVAANFQVTGGFFHFLVMSRKLDK